MTARGGITPFVYAGPRNEVETVSFANAQAYQWDMGTPSVRTALGRSSRTGFGFAWLAYVRRNPSRMSIQDAFRVWRQTGMVPGLPSRLEAMTLVSKEGM